MRALLIRLALDAGRAVAAERLIDAVGARAAVGRATRCRPWSPGCERGRADVVESRPAGYRLAVDPGQVDAVGFERLVAGARAESEPAARAETSASALGLWRGPALAEVATASFAAAPTARLEGLRVEAVEERIEADMALGHAARLVPELEELTAPHPLRERLRGQLMRALYAAGRQAEALAVYEDARRTLADSSAPTRRPSWPRCTCDPARRAGGPESPPGARPTCPRS